MCQSLVISRTERYFLRSQPAPRFLGIGARVDRFRAEIDAAAHQPRAAAEPADEVGLGHRRVGAGDQQALGPCRRSSTSTPCSIRPAPPVMTTMASVLAAPPAAGLPSVTPNRSEAERVEDQQQGAEAQDHNAGPQCREAPPAARPGGEDRAEQGQQSEQQDVADAEQRPAGEIAEPDRAAAGEQQQHQPRRRRPGERRRSARRARSCAGTGARPGRRWRRCRASPRSSSGGCRARRARPAPPPPRSPAPSAAPGRAPASSASASRRARRRAWRCARRSARRGPRARPSRRSARRRRRARGRRRSAPAAADPPAAPAGPSQRSSVLRISRFGHRPDGGHAGRGVERAHGQRRLGRAVGDLRPSSGSRRPRATSRAALASARPAAAITTMTNIMIAMT